MFQNIFQPFAWALFFFTPGTLLSLILFPKVDIIKRITYSIILSSSIGILISAFLYSFNSLNSTYIFLTYITLTALLCLSISKHKSGYNTTYFHKDFFYLLFFSL